MIAIDLIAPEIPALGITQTGRDAFYLLGEHHLKHLPVVKEGKLLGVVSEEDIFNHKVYEPIGEYDFSLIRRFSVQSREHLFEIIRVMADNRLTVIPVVDQEGNYQGLITQSGILRALAHAAAVAEQGAILVLEMQRRDYSLATITRLVEEEDIKVLSAFVSSTQDSDMIELTLKINQLEISRIVATLERHGYMVREAFAESDHHEALQDRYDSFMNYLNM
ncbi:MAG: CBS domain-containing protein [Lewinellaceae bacterium]|nr:CBS domain-containing protein [Lewinellaceae bacterium]